MVMCFELIIIPYNHRYSLTSLILLFTGHLVNLQDNEFLQSNTEVTLGAITYL